MLCPTCLTTMRCHSQIHPLPREPHRQRMDLHCVNKSCLAVCHMGVITEDPKEWVCHDYNFSFNIDSKIYYLQGYDYVVDPFHQRRDPFSKRTILFQPEIRGNFKTVISIDFIPLSTNNDMHERAWDLFYRLYNLIGFA